MELIQRMTHCLEQKWKKPLNWLKLASNAEQGLDKLVFIESFGWISKRYQVYPYVSGKNF
jgi:hypothetical protein